MTTRTYGTCLYYFLAEIINEAPETVAWRVEITLRVSCYFRSLTRLPSSHSKKDIFLLQQKNIWIFHVR